MPLVSSEPLEHLSSIFGGRNVTAQTYPDILFFKGDVGGYMGLLLGGSALTVFEFLDFILCYLISKCCSPKDTRREKRSAKDVETQCECL